MPSIEAGFASIEDVLCAHGPPCQICLFFNPSMVWLGLLSSTLVRHPARSHHYSGFQRRWVTQKVGVIISSLSCFILFWQSGPIGFEHDKPFKHSVPRASPFAEERSGELQNVLKNELEPFITPTIYTPTLLGSSSLLSLKVGLLKMRFTSFKRCLQTYNPFIRRGKNTQTVSTQTFSETSGFPLETRLGADPKACKKKFVCLKTPRKKFVCGQSGRWDKLW